MTDLVLAQGVFKLTVVSPLKDGGTYLIFNQAGLSAKYFGHKLAYNEAFKKLIGCTFDMTGAFKHTTPIIEMDVNKKVKYNDKGEPYKECRIEESTELFIQAMMNPKKDHIMGFFNTLS